MKSRNPGYQPGNYWVICDRCGEAKRISQTRSTWDNLVVCYPECWEPRHPQDFVKAKGDKQAVPIARPDITISLRETTLSSSASKGALTVDLADTSYASDKVGIGVTLDEDTVQWTMINGDLSGSTVTLYDPLIYAASSGNTVYFSEATGDTFITSTDVTVDDL